MACQLTSSGGNWTARTGSIVTLKILADYAFLTIAKYNDQDLEVHENSVSFTVATGATQLLFEVTGPTDVGEGRPPKGRPTSKSLLEPITVVEDCGNGQTQALFHGDEIPTVLAFTIVGN